MVGWDFGRPRNEKIGTFGLTTASERSWQAEQEVDVPRRLAVSSRGALNPAGQYM